MKQQLQEAYDKLIRMSNLNYTLSKEPYMEKLKRELLSKAEAFEASADCLWDKFRGIITEKKSIMFLDKQNLK